MQPLNANDKFSMVSELIESTTMQKHAYLQVEEELDYETVTMYLLVITATVIMINVYIFISCIIY